jgi:hypothetical protein
MIGGKLDGFELVPDPKVFGDMNAVEAEGDGPLAENGRTQVAVG